VGVTIGRIGSPGSSSHGGIVLGILILAPFARKAAGSSLVSTKALDEGGRSGLFSRCFTRAMDVSRREG
jgi:hypothetical protein